MCVCDSSMYVWHGHVPSSSLAPSSFECIRLILIRTTTIIVINVVVHRRPLSSIVVIISIGESYHFGEEFVYIWRVCVCVFKERQQPTTMWLLDRIRPTRCVTPPHNTYWMLYECTSARYSTLMLGLVFAYIVRNRKLFDEHKIAAQAFLSQLSDIFVVILLSVVFYVVQHTAFAGTIRYHMHGMVWHLSSPKNKHEEWEREKYFPASSSSSRILPTELASLFWQT